MNNNDIPVWEKYILTIEPCMCYDEHKSYQGSFQQGREQTP